MDRQSFARIAGLGYLIIFVLAIFANFVVFEAVYVPGDEVQTLTNIDNNQFFAFGVLAFLIVAMVDIVIAWALFNFFKHPLTLPAMLFRATNAVLLAIATAFLAVKDAELFHLIWMVALFAFGIHLLLVAQMLGKTWVQRTLAVLLTIAGLAYLADTTLLLVLENYEAYATTFLTIVAIPSIIGELGFAIWLLVKGFGRNGV